MICVYLLAAVTGALRDDLTIREVKVSNTAYTRMLTAIKDSFRFNATGQPIAVPVRGLGATDRFFEARGRFNAVFTCNTWISSILRAAGQDFGVWTPTPYAVTLSQKRFHTPRRTSRQTHGFAKGQATECKTMPARKTRPSAAP